MLELCKIYLRTLVKSIRYAAAFWGSMVLFGAVIVVISYFFIELSGIPTLIVLGSPTVITLIVSVETRQNYHDVERAYQKSCGTYKLRVGEDLKRICHSKEFWIELLVFCHHMTLLYIVAYRIIRGTPVRNVIIIICSVILFVILNATSWLLVHRIYLKNKI